jgi:hypothetical protein
MKGKGCTNNRKTQIIQVLDVIKRLWWLLNVEVWKCPIISKTIRLMDNGY